MIPNAEPHRLPPSENGDHGVSYLAGKASELAHSPVDFLSDAAMSTTALNFIFSLGKVPDI